MTYTTQFDEKGREIPDPTPLEMPAGMNRPLTIEEQIQRYVRGHLSRMAAENGQETFEEADDLEMDEYDDPDDIMTPYEVHVMASEIAGKDASNLEEKEPPLADGPPTGPAAVQAGPAPSVPSGKPAVDGLEKSV